MYKLQNQIVNTSSKLTDGFIMFGERKIVLSVQRHMWDFLSWAFLISRTCCKETWILISPKYPHKYNNKTIKQPYQNAMFFLLLAQWSFPVGQNIKSHQPLDTLSYFKLPKLGLNCLFICFLEVTRTEEGIQEWSCSTNKWRVYRKLYSQSSG